MKSPFGWLTWIILLLLVFTIGGQAVNSIVGFKVTPTSEVMTLLEGDAKLKEVILIDGEQIVRVTTEDGQRLETAWVGNQVNTILDLLAKGGN